MPRRTCSPPVGLSTVTTGDDAGAGQMRARPRVARVPYGGEAATGDHLHAVELQRADVTSIGRGIPAIGGAFAKSAAPSPLPDPVLPCT